MRVIEKNATEWLFMAWPTQSPTQTQDRGEQHTCIATEFQRKNLIGWSWSHVLGFLSTSYKGWSFQYKHHILELWQRSSSETVQTLHVTAGVHMTLAKSTMTLWPFVAYGPVWQVAHLYMPCMGLWSVTALSTCTVLIGVTIPWTAHPCSSPPSNCNCTPRSTEC